MVLGCGLKLSTTCAASGSTWAPPGATWHELQSSLQMAATCAGLGGAWIGQAVNQGQLLPVPGLGPWIWRYRAPCHQVLLVGDILEMCAASAKTGHWYRNVTGKGLSDPARWMVGASGDHQAWANCVSQVDGDPAMVPTWVL